MKTKVFTAATIQEFESQVNDWLAENPGIQIQFVGQSESDASAHGWSITFTILYKAFALNRTPITQMEPPERVSGF